MIPIPTVRREAQPRRSRAVREYAGRDPLRPAARRLDFAGHRVRRRLRTRRTSRTLRFRARRAACSFTLDGARLSNAAAALGTSLRAITADAGADVLSLGGTKNGLMFGEAICFFNPDAARRSRRLHSKAGHAVRLEDALRRGPVRRPARRRPAGRATPATPTPWPPRLQERLASSRRARYAARPLQRVFATLGRAAIERIRERYYFYVFDEALPEVRWMTHWATTPEDVDEFADFIAACISPAQGGHRLGERRSRRT